MNVKGAQQETMDAEAEAHNTAYWSGPLPSSAASTVAAASSSPSADAPSGLFGSAPRVDKSTRLSPYLARGTASSASKTNTKPKPKVALKSNAPINRPTTSTPLVVRHTNSRMDIGAAAAATPSRAAPTSSSSYSSSSMLDLESILRLAGRAHAADDDGEEDFTAAAANPHSRLPPPPPPPPPAIPSPSAAAPASSRSLVMSADLHRELVDARRRYTALAALSSTMDSGSSTATTAAVPPVTAAPASASVVAALPCYPVTDSDRSAIKSQRQADSKKKRGVLVIPSDGEVDTAVTRRLAAFERSKCELLSASLLASIERASTRLLQPLLAASTLHSLSTPTQIALLKLSYALLGCGGAGASSASASAPRDRFGRPRRAMPSFLRARAEAMPSCMREHHLWSAEEEAQEAAEAEAEAEAEAQEEEEAEEQGA